MNNKYRAWSHKFPIIVCLSLATAQATAAGIELDGASDTGLDTAPNGVPIVNIARPNSKGLSHNTYRRFNVERPGLILNNSKQTVVGTQLGGQILGNTRLKTPARVILNEVTSTNRSLIRGYTEVAGQAADVVIANPNGISVNGAGFINTPRVTLTTGKPEIGASGDLRGFDVQGGDIAIDGAGLDSSQQDVTSIYTHYLSLNAKLHARDLDTVLGKNRLDYPGRKITSVGRGNSDRLVLDSSALGGMYAGKIVLVGTDQGLGMNLPPEVIASSGNIEITNAGRLVVRKVDAGGDIRLRSSQDIESTDTVYGAGNVIVETAAELRVESGMIAAGEDLEIDAGLVENDAILMSGLAADGQVDVSRRLSIEAGELLNRNEIIATGALDVDATEIVNQGLINAFDDLRISARELLNEGTLFSADSATLLLSDELDNARGGSIFSIGDLSLAGDETRIQTARITNDLGLIQTLQGDIDIFAQRFENLGDGELLYEKKYFELGKGVEVDDPLAAMTIDLEYSSGYTKHKSNARKRWINEVLRRLARQAPLLYADNADDIRNNRNARFLAIESRLVDYSTTAPAYLDSGRDINLNIGEFVNTNSVVSAARDINFSISGDYRNVALSASERVTDYQYSVRARHKDNWKNEDRYSSIGRAGYIPVSRTKTVTTNTVTQAGRDINGSIGGQVVNSGVLLGQYQSSGLIDPDDFSRDGVRLPANDFGLFVHSQAPDSQYLIETNPRFTDFGHFVNSSYLLDRIDFSGQATLKRLGDAFYESRLIRDSVFAQTGRRFLDPGIQNDNEQFQYLMDNALVAQHELELAPGIALREDQINGLTRDIVWLVQREIDGQQVLVPTVYLANGRDMAVRGGRLLAGRDTGMTVASLSNAGLIEAGGNLVIESRGEVANRGVMRAAGELELSSAGNIENISGRVRGQTVSLDSSEGDIVNRRAREDYAYKRKHLDYSTTHLGEAGIIEAGERLRLEAAGSIEVSGSTLRGGDVELKAQTIDIEAAATNEHYLAGDKKNHVQEASTRHFASTISGDDIVILSRGASRVSGSAIEAVDNLDINAGSIEIGTVNGSEYYASVETRDKTLGESVHKRKTFRSKNHGSTLNGATVVLVTEHGDIEISGSRIAATDKLVMDSGRDLRIEAGHDDSFDENYKHESGWFSGNALYAETEDLEGRVTSHAVSTRIDAASLEMTAREDIDLSGVDIRVDRELSASAENIRLANAIDEVRTYSKHTEVTVTLDDLASNPGTVDDLFDVEDGKLKIQLGGAHYDNAETTTRNTTVIASQVAADAIRFDAGKEGEGDITIEGSDLYAQGSIEMNAGGDVALLDAHHESVTEDLTQQGSGIVSLTVKNEYDQVARAIKAVRDAEQALEQTRNEYDDYRDEVRQQRRKLKRLKHQLAGGTGFVEQADINEFKRHLSRLEDDDEYYQTNIALATATLVSKTTALIQQTGRAASSSGTYGFNMGIELDIDALEKQLDKYRRESRASNLIANRLTIDAGDRAKLRGSNLLAGESLDIRTGEIDIEAGRSTQSNREREQKVNLSYSWDLLGSASSTDPRDLGAGLSAEGSKRDSESRFYTNSQLTADNIRLEAQGDAAIEGADIAAGDRLEVAAESLEVSSVQDISWSDHHSRGLSYSGAGTGVNGAEGYDETVQTRVTRLTGQQVDIGVAGHTDLQGAVIAAIDENGADNGQLRLTTESLGAGSLNNRTDRDNRSIGLSGGQTSTLDFSDDSADNKSKSLATIGEGEIVIRDIDRSDTRFLNNDIADTEVAIYEIDSHRGLSGELDTRLLSEAGRSEIAEDWLKTRMIGNTIKLIGTTKRVGITDFFEETDKTHKTYEAIKQEIATDPLLAAMLQNPGLTPEQKQSMLDQVTDAVMLRLGFKTHDNKIIATDATAPGGEKIHGFYSEETGNAYINDHLIEDTRGLLTATGHEAAHAMENQDGVDFDKLTAAEKEDSNRYADNYGENLAGYANFALDNLGYDGLAQTNKHAGLSSETVKDNNSEFSGIDKNKGDFYLDPEDKQRYTQYMNALFDCNASSDGCTAEEIARWQPEAIRLQKLDQDTDARLTQACRVASSPACRTEVRKLKEMLQVYRDLIGNHELKGDGVFPEYLKIARLFGEYGSEAMSDNTKKALVNLHIDTLSGIADMSEILLKASTGDETARHQVGLISAGILSFLEDPAGTIEQNIKSQLEEAQRLREQGDINQAEEIESRVFLEGAIAIAGTANGMISLSRLANSAIDIPDIHAAELAGYKEILGVGADGNRIGLPKGYSYVSSTADGEIAIRGPRGGIYKATDKVDQHGNPLYENGGKLYSMEGRKIDGRVSKLPSQSKNKEASSKANLIETDLHADFYIKNDGTAIQSVGYRYIDSHAPYIKDLLKTGLVPENVDGTYISFDKFENAIDAADKLQVPHNAQIRLEFDTKQMIDQIEIPKGKWGTANYLEPIVKDFPNFGSGKATQAITRGQIKIRRIKDLKSGEILYESN